MSLFDKMEKHSGWVIVVGIGMSVLWYGLIVTAVVVGIIALLKFIG